MAAIAQHTRWRGFNMPNLCFPPGDFRCADMIIQGYGRYFENEFRWIADWGFNWVRLAVSYDWYVLFGNPQLIDDDALRVIDNAVAWGQRYGVHVNLALVHAPGYVNGVEYFLTRDPFDLWKDEAAQACFNEHWRNFARRYKGISADSLSFCLLAEPARTDNANYARVMRAASQAIEKADPSRPVVIEGNDYGNEPVPELLDVGVTHCCRGYNPFFVSTYKAWWLGPWWMEKLDPIAPEWPKSRMESNDIALAKQCCDEKALRQFYQGWVDLNKQGMPVHCAEMGFWNRTPHKVGLAWMETLLGLFSEWGFGWALWNFTGSFGILDSARTDAKYSDFYGHRLDDEYLKLLQRY